MYHSPFFRFLCFVTLTCLGGIAKAQPAGQTAHLIYLRQQADVTAAHAYTTKRAKGQYVYNQLQRTARKTQPGLISLLQKEGVAHRPLWIVNAIYAEGLSPEFLRHLEQHRAVVMILQDVPVHFSPPVDAPRVNLRSKAGPEWNIRQIQADQVWHMGITGSGVTIGGQDTGVDWTHPSLTHQYRGRRADTINHNYQWFDAISEVNPYWSDTSSNPCGLSTRQPCDDHVHGTHTMGSMVGDDGADNQIGVAPGAQWVAARNMDRGVGSPTTYLRCFQWFLAPTDLNGRHPRPDLAPDVVNNSWYCPEDEGCTPEFQSVFAQAITNLNAAGIFVVVSAGNAGEACQTINTIPASIEPAFATGATDEQDEVASFSARGPAFSFSGEQLAKPDITAPGVQVRSAGLEDTYRTFSGTSMAGPHVAGTVALMLSANPDLRGAVDTLEAILRRTATPLQSSANCNIQSLPNRFDPAYGYGRIDALAAVQEALSTTTNSSSQPTGRKAVVVFPNPVHQQLQFLLPEQIKTGYLRIFDSLGRPVRDQQLVRDSRILRLDFGDQPAGAYFYEIRWNQERRTGRFVKQ